MRKSKHIIYKDAENYPDNPWIFTWQGDDYDLYDYGNVSSWQFALECVARDIERVKAGRPL
jgi:hypothetical protein